jgi:hypothetical protein
MWVFDRTMLRFLAGNRAAIARYGFTEEEFFSMTIADIPPMECVPELVEDVAKRHRGLQKPGNWKHRKKNGETIDVEVVCHDLEFQGVDDAAAIIGIANTLHLTVVAEGVETEPQLSFLRDHQCDEIQGSYFGKPLPAAEMAQLLKSASPAGVPVSPSAGGNAYRLSGGS